MKEPTLVLLLVQNQALCFVRQPTASWQLQKLHGEDRYPLPADRQFSKLLEEISGRCNRSDRLAAFALHVVCDGEARPWLAEAGRALAAVRCQRWQVLEWQPLHDRSQNLLPNPSGDVLSPAWLQQSLLPLLEATFDYQDEALRAAQAAERERAQHAHAETLESLRADRQQLEAEIIRHKQQLAAMQRPSLDELITFLPAIYQHIFGSLSPSDLALLAGSLEIPVIPSPWPEPSPDTLQMQQSRLRALPPARANVLRQFCLQLPHRRSVRPEMRAWLGATP
jgi:hypothetical protein